MNITKITITKEDGYYQIIINYGNGTHDFLNVYEIDSILDFISKVKK